MRRKFCVDREPSAFRLAGEKSHGQGRDDVLLSAQGPTTGARDGGCTGRWNNFVDLRFKRDKVSKFPENLVFFFMEKK